MSQNNKSYKPFAITSQELAGKKRGELIDLFQAYHQIVITDLRVIIETWKFDHAEQKYQATGCVMNFQFNSTDSRELVAGLSILACSLIFGHVDAELTDVTFFTHELWHFSNYDITVNLTPEAVLETARDIRNHKIKDGFEIEFYLDDTPPENN